MTVERFYQPPPPRRPEIAGEGDELCGRCTYENLSGCGDGRGYPACTEPRTGRIVHGDATEEAWEAATPPGMTPGGVTILEEAQALVYGERQDAYGHPADDYARTALIWTAILGVDVTAKQAALCMVAVKLSRECHRPSRDNLVDGAGYFAVAARIENRLAGSE